MAKELCWICAGLFSLLSGCATDCTYTDAQLSVFNAANEQELLTIKASVCPEASATIVENDTYYILSVVSESALANNEDPWNAFEQGRQITFPLIGINEQSRHLIEVRHRSSLWNNLDDPYISYWTNTSEGATSSFTANASLTGHPLYLILSLLNADDKGGSKTWAIFNWNELNGAPMRDIRGWECFMNNRYSFMKGNRFKYDPNGPSDEGPLCRKDSALFGRFEEATEVYGTYIITQSEDELLIKTKSTVSFDQFYEATYEVIFYDWNQLHIVMTNDADQKAIAVLTPYQYDEDL